MTREIIGPMDDHINVFLNDHVVKLSSEYSGLNPEICVASSLVREASYCSEKCMTVQTDEVIIKAQ